jgi:hypothetical protein
MRRMYAFLSLMFLSLTALVATPAAAQVYLYPDPYVQPRPRYGPPPEYGYGYRYRQPQQFGDVCITSRGNCRVNWVPAGSGCRCMIPGFGPKRGNVIASRRGGGFYYDD